MTKVNIPQNLVSGIASYGTLQIATEEVKKILGDSPHSIDMIELGLRTRTTRSVGEMQKYNIKVGDIVTQFGKSANGTTKSILTKITAIYYKSTPEFLNTWNKEGWTIEGIDYIKRFKEGAAAIEFELVNKPNSGTKIDKTFEQLEDYPDSDNLLELVSKEEGFKNTNKYQATYYGTCSYKYTGGNHMAKPFPEYLSKVAEYLEDIENLPRGYFNMVLINKYPSNKGLGKHRDNELEITPYSTIASISLGAGRIFSITKGYNTPYKQIELKHGNIVMMRDNSQIDYYHEVIPNEGIRYNLTFRHNKEAKSRNDFNIVKYLDKDDGITHINVYSKGKTELGRLLSNFAHTPFKYNNEIFQSVESYWYYIKTNNLDFKDKIGYRAKEYYRNNYPKNYKGSNPSEEQLKEIYKLKLQYHPNIKKLLLENNLPFAHYYIMDGKQIDANEFLWTAKLWEKIKEDLLNDKPFKILVTGGRDFNDYERLEKDILSIVETKDIKNLKLMTDNPLAIRFYQNYKEVELERFNILNINNITNHSGGALGADSKFDIIGREYGFNNHIHYYHGNKTPLGNKKLSIEEILEGIEQAKKASRILGKSWNNKYASLLGRNWFQVKNSDIIIAIASLIHPKEEGVRGYINKTNKTVVSGGTSYSVEMAILHNKSVFVYDLKTKCWYRYEDSKYIECDVPLITKNFAGVGSRQDNGKMSEDSIQAIRDIYERYLDYNSNIYYKLVKGVKPNLVLAYYDKKNINTKHCIENTLKLNYDVVVNYY